MLIAIFLGACTSVRPYSHAAPVNGIDVYGEIKDYNTGKELDEGEVMVIEADTLVLHLPLVDRKWETGLDYDRQYRLSFSAPGRVSKFLEIDTRNIPLQARSGGFAMRIQMTLFYDNDSLSACRELFKTPFASCKYAAATGYLMWNEKLTQEWRKKLMACGGL